MFKMWVPWLLKLWVSGATAVAQLSGHAPSGPCSPLISRCPCRLTAVPSPERYALGTLLISPGTPFPASHGPTVSSIKTGR